MRTSSITVASICLLSLASGCLYEIRDEIIDSQLWITNHFRASNAWHRSESAYDSVDYVYDFRKGFMAGYAAAANGANHCPPAIPPSQYWKVWYQSEEGKSQTNAWFDGYSHGALAADSDGVAELNRIVTRGRIDDGGQQSGQQIELPADGHRPPTEMIPEEPAPDDSISPTPADSVQLLDRPNGIRSRRRFDLSEPVDEFNPSE